MRGKFHGNMIFRVKKILKCFFRKERHTHTDFINLDSRNKIRKKKNTVC